MLYISQLIDDSNFEVTGLSLWGKLYTLYTVLKLHVGAHATQRGRMTS